MGVYCGAVGDEEDSGALEKSLNFLITIHAYTTAGFFYLRGIPGLCSQCACAFFDI